MIHTPMVRGSHGNSWWLTFIGHAIETGDRVDFRNVMRRILWVKAYKMGRLTFLLRHESSLSLWTRIRLSMNGCTSSGPATFLRIHDDPLDAASCTASSFLRHPLF